MDTTKNRNFIVGVKNYRSDDHIDAGDRIMHGAIFENLSLYDIHEVSSTKQTEVSAIRRLGCLGKSAFLELLTS